MKLLSRRDATGALATGLTAGAIATGILLYLQRSLPLGLNSLVLVVVIPATWLAGVQLGFALSRHYLPLAQFSRFVAIGFANAMVDFGVLYLGIALTGASAGLGFSVLKAGSFFIATVHSFFWNKYWAFEAGNSRGGTREAAAFVSVAVVAILVNVVVASVVVALRPDTATPDVWAGISAVAGSAVALIFSFVGFRLFVFRKQSRV